jgi:hypothetical protein
MNLQEKCILVDRAVLLSWAVASSRGGEHRPEVIADEVVADYDQALYESVAMSAIEHVLRSHERLSKKLVAIPSDTEFGLSAFEVRELDEAVGGWCRRLQVLQAIQSMERQLTGPSRTPREHIGYAVRLLLLAKHFKADILPWRPRFELIKAILQTAGFSIELKDRSKRTALMTALPQDDALIPHSLSGDVRMICMMPPQRDKPDVGAPSATRDTSADQHPHEATTVFVSYAHEDRRWHDLLAAHLHQLKASKRIVAWSDKEIGTGDHWEHEIRATLDTASVAVLLVTPHFLASEFITSVELPFLVKRADAGHLRIVWLAVSSSFFDGTELSRFQAANDPSVPLDLMPPARRNRELVRICRSIEQIASEADALNG